MTDIDKYLNNVDADQRAELERIRQMIKSIVPEAQEVISYGMPVFKVDGKYLVGIAAFKGHMSIFPGAAPIKSLADRLSGFKLSKGTVQFTLEKRLPDEIIKQIVDYSLARIRK